DIGRGASERRGIVARERDAHPVRVTAVELNARTRNLAQYLRCPALERLLRAARARLVLDRDREVRAPHRARGPAAVHAAAAALRADRGVHALEVGEPREPLTDGLGDGHRVLERRARR